MSEQIQEEISLKELFQKVNEWGGYLKTKWLFIALALILGAIAGLGYWGSQKPIYTANLSFALEGENASSGGGGLSGLASQFGFDVGGSAGSAFSGANLIELMKSRTLVTKTLLSSVMFDGKEITLIEYYIQFNRLREKWGSQSELFNVQFSPNTDENKLTLIQNQVMVSVYGQVLSNLLSVTQRDKKISIIYVQVKSENELFSKFFTETIVKVVSDFYIETKSKKAKLNLAILQGQTDSIRKELNAAMLGVASANDNTFNLNQALNINRVPSARKQIDVQANTAMLTQLVQNLELAKVSLRKETPLIQVIDIPILPLEVDRISISKSIFIGGILGAFLVIVFFICIRVWKILKESL